MRNRAYKPMVSDCLEERALLSTVAGLSHHQPHPSHNSPYVLTRERYNKFRDHARLAFIMFTKDFGPSHPYEDEQLLDSLRNVSVLIPFGAMDGLGVKIHGIVEKLHEDLIDRVPHAIHSAAVEVEAAAREIVVNRVQAGDLILR